MTLPPPTRSDALTPFAPLAPPVHPGLAMGSAVTDATLPVGTTTPVVPAHSPEAPFVIRPMLPLDAPRPTPPWTAAVAGIVVFVVVVFALAFLR